MILVVDDDKNIRLSSHKRPKQYRNNSIIMKAIFCLAMNAFVGLSVTLWLGMTLGGGYSMT